MSPEEYWLSCGSLAVAHPALLLPLLVSLKAWELTWPWVIQIDLNSPSFVSGEDKAEAQEKAVVANFYSVFSKTQWFPDWYTPQLQGPTGAPDGEARGQLGEMSPYSTFSSRSVMGMFCMDY